LEPLGFSKPNSENHIITLSNKVEDEEDNEELVNPMEDENI
jgi:hypothetical protein